MNKEWYTPDELCEKLFGKDWREQPEMIAAKKWVHENWLNEDSDLWILRGGKTGL